MFKKMMMTRRRSVRTAHQSQNQFTPLLSTSNPYSPQKKPISWFAVLITVWAVFLMMFFLALLFSEFETVAEYESKFSKLTLLEEQNWDFSQDKNERYLRIEASNLYEAGFQLGARTANRMRKFFQTDEMLDLIKFVNTPAGRRTFEALKRDNTHHFPDFAREIQGQADGARVNKDLVWITNLFPELTGNLPDGTHSTWSENFAHCADVYSYDSEGYAMEAHTEDWSPAVAPLWLLVDYIPTGNATFSKCSGFAYPGTLIGYASTWNSNGIYHSQNTLLPAVNRNDGGWACTFAQRYANCGSETHKASTSIEEFMTRIHEHEWASGSNLNVVDVAHNKMASIENWMNDFSIHWVLPTRSYYHFNWFQHLGTGEEVDNAKFRIENILRAMKIEQSPEPKTYEEMLDLISSKHDLGDDFRGHRVAIHRYNTLATFIVDGARGTVDVWEQDDPKMSPPKYTWNIYSVEE